MIKLKISKFQKSELWCTGKNFYELIETDVVVVGGGLAGILAAKKLLPTIKTSFL